MANLRVFPGWFPIDLVSCLPFSYVVYIVPGAQEDGVGGGENKAIKVQGRQSRGT